MKYKSRYPNTDMSSDHRADMEKFIEYWNSKYRLTQHQLEVMELQFGIMYSNGGIYQIKK